MKSNDVLPADKICFSERMLRAGLSCWVVGIALTVLAMALEMPWTVFIAVAVLGRLGVVEWRRRSRSPRGGIHGDADWASDEEIAAAGLIGGTGAVLGKLPSRTRQKDPFLWLKVIGARSGNVGRFRYLAGQLVKPANSKDTWAVRSLVRIPDTDRVAHTALYLPTGIGKTHRVVIPSLLQCRDNAVVYDPSGDTLRATAEFRQREFGHDIRVIDPFNVCGLPVTDRLNVLDPIGCDHPGCFDYANYLSHALVVEKQQAQHDPFWHEATIVGTVFLLLAIMRNGNRKIRNLLSLGELLDAERLRTLAESLADHPDLALRRRAMQILNYKGKTLDSLLACLTGEHGWMDSPAFSAVLADSTFTPKSLLEKPTTLYIVIPGHRAVESQAFVRTLMTAILFTAFEAGPDVHRPPVRLYLDEVATLGKLELLTTLFTQGRKYGLRSMSFFQSVGQVAEITGSPEKIQTVRSQMAIEIFKGQDYDTAKQVSEWIGNKTVQTASSSRQETSNGGWSNSTGVQSNQSRSGGWSGGTTDTVSETGVPVIRPEQVLQLHSNEAILLAAGNRPVRVNILDAIDVQRCADSNAASRYEKLYLYRVRCMALLFCLIGPASVLLGCLLTAKGAVDLVNRSQPAVDSGQQFEPVQRFDQVPPSRPLRQQQRRR
ncbi:MAG: type IV secretory system conjugative DNA transfer family protein [Planctomycetes bacterium]|nr:type IV secretory system conjugative DNA transfer family protein [Planctomycetota bacterium]